MLLVIVILMLILTLTLILIRILLLIIVRCAKMYQGTTCCAFSKVLRGVKIKGMSRKCDFVTTYQNQILLKVTSWQQDVYMSVSGHFIELIIRVFHEYVRVTAKS